MTARPPARGYCLPFMITAWVARYVPKGKGPLLDAGCGTGLSGPYLRALGYDAIEGLDFSEEMLAIARRRNAYSELKQAVLGETLPWPDGHFAAFLSTGVFTEGHAPGLEPRRTGAHHQDRAATQSSPCATRCSNRVDFATSSNGWKRPNAGSRSRKARCSGPSPLPSRRCW